MLEFKHVSKSYHQTQILNDINFTVNAGEVVVLIGPSGCGKTTCLKMINRLTRITSGEILFEGEDICKQDPIALRRRMGYVIQQTGLFPHMTIKENIEIIPKLEKRDPKAIAARTMELMDMIGLDPDTYLYRYPTQLSGGQQQRIGVARAFATDPEIILMDEPFSALDPITRAQLQDELVSLQAQLKKSIVFVTHDMDEAIKIADKICIMHNGHILQFDTPENIMKSPADEFVRNFVGRKRIWNNPELIKAKDIMLTNPIIAPEDVSILRAVEIMRANKVDSLMITDVRHHLVGIVSISMLRPEMDTGTLLKDIMNTQVVKAGPEDSIVNLLTVINEKGLPTLPVVDDKGVLIGLITRGSLVSTLSQQFISVNEEAK